MLALVMDFRREVMDLIRPRVALATAGRDGSTENFKVFRGHSGGGTPGPIPNPEVKPSSADGTAGESLWESRWSPG